MVTVANKSRLVSVAVFDTIVDIAVVVGAFKVLGFTGGIIVTAAILVGEAIVGGAIVKAIKNSR